MLTNLLRDLFRMQTQRTEASLSIVVNFYNNRREARNTLYSLTRAYQQDASDIPYEVIAVDNGSTEPLSEAEVQSFGPEFHYRFMQTASVSPVEAINLACRDATGSQLLVMIDGAHILTPCIFRLVREAFAKFESPFVATVPFYLGPTKQTVSVQEGYNQDVEDRLLQASGWKDNGYKLYTVSASFIDDSGGWYGQLFESCCFAMRKTDYLMMGGFDERFQSRGGGLANLDFFQRALIRHDLRYVVLLGEGTFHQVHGGVATSAPPDRHPWSEFHDEFIRIRGHRFARVPRPPVLIGEVPKEAMHAAEFSREVGRKVWEQFSAIVQ